MTALTPIKQNTPRIDEPETVNTMKWPIAVRSRMRQPKLDLIQEWIDWNNYQIKNERNDGVKYAVAAANCILKEGIIIENNPNLAMVVRKWLSVKVDQAAKAVTEITQKNSEPFEKFCEANNCCRVALKKPRMNFEAYLKSCGFTLIKEESKQENKKA